MLAQELGYNGGRIMSVDEIVGGITGEISGGGVNYIALTEWIETIRNVCNFLSGVIVYTLVICVPLIIAIELLYINIPPLKSSIDNLLERLDEKGIKSKGTQLILRDAILAVKRASTVDTGVSANMIYMQIKAKSIFLAAFIIALTLGGGPYIIEIIVSIATGILGGLSGLAT